MSGRRPARRQSERQACGDARLCGDCVCRLQEKAQVSSKKIKNFFRGSYIRGRPIRTAFFCANCRANLAARIFLTASNIFLATANCAAQFYNAPQYSPRNLIAAPHPSKPSATAPQTYHNTRRMAGHAKNPEKKCPHSSPIARPHAPKKCGQRAALKQKSIENPPLFATLQFAIPFIICRKKYHIHTTTSSRPCRTRNLSCSCKAQK